MAKSTIPVHEPLRTKKLRLARVRLWRKRQSPHAAWLYAFEQLEPAHVALAVGSKRKNLKGVRFTRIAEVHHESMPRTVRVPGPGIDSTEFDPSWNVPAPAHFVVTTQYAVVSLADGRCAFLCRRSTDFGTTLRVTLSHELEHLWWYGVTQAAREAFARNQ